MENKFGSRTAAVLDRNNCFSNQKNLFLHLIKNKYSHEYRINILDCTNKNKYNVDTQLLFEEKHIQSLHSDSSSPLPRSNRRCAALQTARTMSARKGMVK